MGDTIAKLVPWTGDNGTMEPSVPTLCNPCSCCEAHKTPSQPAGPAREFNLITGIFIGTLSYCGEIRVKFGQMNPFQGMHMVCPLASPAAAHATN